MRLADFIVHTAVSARQAGLKLAGFYRENTLRLAVGDEFLCPDCAFQLVTPSGFPFSFFVELDNSTEAIHSDKDRDSWESKLRLYDAFQDLTAVRFRVLVLATRSSQRVSHILDAAKTVFRNPKRGLVYGACLDDFLARADALTWPCFRDHLGRPRALVWYVRPPAAAETGPYSHPPRACYSPVPASASAIPV
jgi:hypothetical protein